MISGDVNQIKPDSFFDADRFAKSISTIKPYIKCGEIYQVGKSLVKAKIKNVNLGEICQLGDEPYSASNSKKTYGEITAIRYDDVDISVAGKISDIAVGTPVFIIDHSFSFSVSEDMVGEVFDEKGQPQYLQKPLNQDNAARYFESERVHALSRQPINEMFRTGVNSIDACLTLGKGQRVGLFGPAGCGKSTLTAMIARNSEADICILALVGERGREVNEFLQNELSHLDRQKCIVFFSTSDSSPIERIWTARRAFITAEYFASRGASVLLIMDSLTRYCRALREVAVQAGEFPIKQGFPLSVFDDIPKLVEKAGNFNKGCITGIFVVLEESAEIRDVLAEEIVGLLDGHIILSRSLAERSHFPAIDVRKSLSRLMNRIAHKKQVENSDKLKKLQNKYDEIELLIQVGEYKTGNDPIGDLALKCKDKIDNFLQQGPRELSDFNKVLLQLNGAVNE